MANSKDIFKLQPGATYSVQIVPKDKDSNNDQFPRSFNKIFTVPNTNADGTPITASNTTVTIYQSTSTVFVAGATMVAASNFFFNASGLTVWQPNTTASVFYINAKTGDVGLKGNITATSGLIGGFTIQNDKLSASATGTYVGISGSGEYAFWAGSATASSAPFYVKNDGTSKVSGIQIGNVGGFTITGSALYGGTSGSITGLNPYNASATIFAGATSSAGDNAKLYITNSGSIYSTGGASFSGPVMSAASMSAPVMSGAVTNSGSLVGGSIFVPNTSTPLFKVDSVGNMTATNASVTGFISANSGSVGGWAINTGSLTSGTGASAVGISTGNYAFYAGNATPSSAPFSVTNTGNLYAQNAVISGSINASSGIFSGLLSATTGSIGGFTISTNSLSATNISLSSTTGFNLGSGQFTVSQAGAMVAQNASVTGQISASSGNIAGWTLTNQEIGTGSGANRVALNSTAGSPKIYIGYGNYGTGDTGFYADSSGYFSLGNQLTFAPGKGSASIVTTSATFTNNSTIVTTTYNNSSSVIIPGMLVTNPLLPTGVKVASVTYGTNATASLNYTYTGTTQTTNTTFQSDNLSLLTVNGTIRGAVDSVTPISSPTLFATVTSASVSSASTVLLTASGGHFFSASSVLIFTNLPSTNGLNLLNYAASAGNAYSIISTPNSTQFIISSGSLALTAGNVPSASAGRASIQQLTMGLHPAMNAGTSWANNTGTGVRLDDYNWWLVNNQFRIGNPLSYLKYDGSQFRIQGGGDKTLILQVGAANSANQFAITASSNTSGNYNNIDTPFYVDGSGKMSLGNAVTWDGTQFKVQGGSTYSTVLQVGATSSANLIAIYNANAATGNYTNTYNNNYYASVSGVPTFNDVNTPFYVDGTGRLSLGTGLVWDTANLSIEGTINGLTIGFGNSGKGTISSNTALGVNALNSNTTGSKNFAAGPRALTANTTGTSNLAIGNNALASNISTSYNLAIGENALSSFNNIATQNNSGGNIAIGLGSMYFSASAQSNVAIGPFALAGNPAINNNHGFGNIAIGDHSLFWQAGYGASANVAIGYYAFGAQQTVPVGYLANTENVAIGSYALFQQGYSISNVAIGASALFGANNAGAGSYYSVAIGSAALQNDSNSAYSVAIGWKAFQSMPAMAYWNNNSIAIGAQAGRDSYGISNSVLLGVNAGVEVGSPDQTQVTTDLIGIGTGALLHAYDSSYNIGLGNAALNKSASTTQNIAIGGYSMATIPASATQNISFGQYSMYYISGVASANIGIGYQSLFYASVVNNNVAMGYQVFSGSTLALPFTGSGNVAIGNYIGNNASSAYDSVIIGNNVAASAKPLGNKNVYIGGNILSNVPATASTSNSNNVIIGYAAFSNASAGVTNSIGIGPNSLQNITSGDKNIAIGYATGPTSGSLSNTITIGDSVTASVNYQAVIGNTSHTVTIPGKLNVVGYIQEMANGSRVSASGNPTLISFPTGRFSAVPSVVATAINSGTVPYGCFIGTTTTTGFNVTTYNATTGAQAVTLINYVAMNNN